MAVVGIMIKEFDYIMRSSNYLRQAKRRQARPAENSNWGFSTNDQIVGKDSLASIMDVTITTVERWIRADMPVAQRGDQLHDWIFDLADVKQWRSSFDS